MSHAFDPTHERTRYHARLAFLAGHWAMALELAPGIRFQPETAASVEDQVRETFWSEGNDPAEASEEELAEMRSSFAALSPRPEADGWSVTATLMLGFPDDVRAERLAALAGFPEGLRVLLDEGSEVRPEVDRGHTGGSERLPAVLVLRYRIPTGRWPVALLSNHLRVAGTFQAPPGWAAWVPAASVGAAQGIF
jgi:hypothetical protein